MERVKGLGYKRYKLIVEVGAAGSERLSPIAPTPRPFSIVFYPSHRADRASFAPQMELLFTGDSQREEGPGGPGGKPLPVEPLDRQLLFGLPGDGRHVLLLLRIRTLLRVGGAGEGRRGAAGLP